MEQSGGPIRGMDSVSLVFCSATHRSTQSAFNRRRKKRTHKLSIDCQALPWQHSDFFSFSSRILNLWCFKSWKWMLSLVRLCNYCLFECTLFDPSFIYCSLSPGLTFSASFFFLSASLLRFVFIWVFVLVSSNKPVVFLLLSTGRLIQDALLNLEEDMDKNKKCWYSDLSNSLHYKSG